MTNTGNIAYNELRSSNKAVPSRSSARKAFDKSLAWTNSFNGAYHSAFECIEPLKNCRICRRLVNGAKRGVNRVHNAGPRMAGTLSSARFVPNHHTTRPHP